MGQKITSTITSSGIKLWILEKMKKSEIQKLKYFTKLKKLDTFYTDIVKNGLIQKEKHRDTYNRFATDL